MFNQSSRSLALLERAGSRQPLCLSEVEPSLVLSETPSSLALPLAFHLSLLLTPRNISPAGSDSMASGSGMDGSSSSNKNNNNNNHNHNHNSGSIRSGAAAALVQTYSHQCQYQHSSHYPTHPIPRVTTHSRESL
jgi:hypothetical protein